MIAFTCIIGLVLGVYLYRTIARAGSGFSAGGSWLAETAPRPFSTSPWALPLALAAGWLLKGVWTTVGFPFFIMCHEVGHSLTAWLAGYWSLPAIVGLAVTESEPSLLLSALVAGAIAWISWLAVKWRNPLTGLCAALLWAGFAYLHFLASPARYQECMSLAGHAGEFVFPALLIAAFYYRGPGRWDWFRYPVMAAAACTLVYASHFWLAASADPQTAIYGVDITDPSVAHQDIARLVSGGWTARQAADRFLLLGWSAWAFVAAFYLWFWRSRPAPAAERNDETL